MKHISNLYCLLNYSNNPPIGPYLSLCLYFCPLLFPSTLSISSVHCYLGISASFLLSRLMVCCREDLSFTFSVYLLVLLQSWPQRNILHFIILLFNKFLLLYVMWAFCVNTKFIVYVSHLMQINNNLLLCILKFICCCVLNIHFYE